MHNNSTSTYIYAARGQGCALPERGERGLSLSVGLSFSRRRGCLLARETRRGNTVLRELHTPQSPEKCHQTAADDPRCLLHKKEPVPFKICHETVDKTRMSTRRDCHPVNEKKCSPHANYCSTRWRVGKSGVHVENKREGKKTTARLLRSHSQGRETPCYFPIRQ